MMYYGQFSGQLVTVDAVRNTETANKLNETFQLT